jgi:hypothetical protein
MPSTHEEQFIECFVLKEKRERYREKLSRSAKRSEFLDRLNHSADLDARFVEWIPSNVSTVDLLKRHGAPATCTAISADSSIDGREMPLNDAVNAAELRGSGTIISCISGKLGLYISEDGERRAVLIRNR